MDINIEIVKELEYKQSIIVVKTENECEYISNLDIKTERDLRVEENQNSNLTATFVKKEPDDNVERLKDQFSSGEVDESLYEIKTEELMLKSDDSKTGIHFEDDTDETHLFDVSDYKAHISVEHDESMLKKYGYLSDFITNLRKSLDNHLQKHKYSCDQCEYNTHKKIYLKRHSLVKHDKNAIKKHACDHCEYRTHMKCHLKSHVMVKHDKNAIKKYGCYHCEYKSHRKDNLKKHVLAIHVKKALKKYACDHCEYKTHEKTHFDVHVLIHDKNALKKYGCDHCEYKTHFKNALKIHVLLKHDTNAIKNTDAIIVNTNRTGKIT